PIRTLMQGDIVAAYLKGNGYVGIGRVKEQAVKVNDFKIDGKSLNTLDIKTLGIYDNCDNENSEFPIRIEWIKSVDRNNGKWKSNGGLFSSQLIKASLQGQPKTIEYLEKEFEINFNEIMLSE